MGSRTDEIIYGQVRVLCLDCWHFADFTVGTRDVMHGHKIIASGMTFQEAHRRFKCSRCGSKRVKIGPIKSKPDGLGWSERYGSKGR